MNSFSMTAKNASKNTYWSKTYRPMDNMNIYVAAKATYIRLLHGKIGFFLGGGVSALAP